MALTSYIVIAEGEDILGNILGEEPKEDLTPTAIISIPIEVREIDTINNMDGIKISEIDCDKGSFYVSGGKYNFDKYEIKKDCDGNDNRQELLAIEVNRQEEIQNSRNQIKQVNKQFTEVKLRK